jgi:hypothetical protein
MAARRVVLNEAKMRLGNTETLRSLAFRRIARAVEAGKLTESEARQLRAQFWDERLKDKKVASGEWGGQRP